MKWYFDKLVFIFDRSLIVRFKFNILPHLKKNLYVNWNTLSSKEKIHLCIFNILRNRLYSNEF